MSAVPQTPFALREPENQKAEPVVVSSGRATRTGAKHAAIYARVSTAKKTPRPGGTTPEDDTRSFEQRPEIQIEALTALATQRGWKVAGVYQDRASGAKEKRPGLHALMTDARRGAFDAVIVWRFDRFARSVKQLVLALEEFRALNIDFISHQESLDTSTPMGTAMFQIIAAMAELERAVIRERVLAGQDYARNHGTKSGQPIGRPPVVFRRDHVVQLRKEGHSWRQIADRLNVSSGSVRRAYRAALADSQACQNSPGEAA
jgi:DNA invertase Pin-like site-specific DNA recombinase